MFRILSFNSSDFTSPFTVINQSSIVDSAINAYRSGEVVEIKQPLAESLKSTVTSVLSSTSTQIDQENEDENKSENEKESEKESENNSEAESEASPVESPQLPIYEPSERAKLGKELEDTMSSGEEVPEKLIIDLLVNALQDRNPTTHFVLVGSYNLTKISRHNHLRFRSCKIVLKTGCPGVVLAPEFENRHEKFEG